MWPLWLKSPKKVQSTPNSSPRRNFICSSLKDIHSILREESESRSRSTNTLIKPSIFHRARMPSLSCRSVKIHNAANQGIVIYFTSLRVVRKTYEDCRAVKSILRGFRVPMDERDLSMESRYMEELLGIMGSKETIKLPCVFIGGQYIGGAGEIKELNESGELKRLIKELPSVDPGSSVCKCNSCGGLRFVLCDECNGSHKIYADKCGFRPCLACNANGLIRCPLCSSSVLRRSSTAK